MKDDPVDRFSVSREDNFPRQEMVSLDTLDQLPKRGVALDCGKQIVTPRILFPPKMKGKTGGSKATTRVGFP